MEKVHQAKMCHEVFMSEGRKVDARVTWQRWEEGARQQAQLREEVLSARRNKERQRRMAQVCVCMSVCVCCPFSKHSCHCFGLVLCRSIVAPSRWHWRRRLVGGPSLTCSR